MARTVDSVITTKDPFIEAKSAEDKIKYILRYGILSPSTHNTQPWKFQIKEGACYIYIDTELFLPEADPDKRNLYISIGCLIETIVTVSEYYGVYDKVIYSGLDSKLVARIYFKNLNAHEMTPNNNYQGLMKSITKRATYRGVFTDRPIERQAIRKIIDNSEAPNVNISYFGNSKEKENIVELTCDAVAKIASDSSFRYELSNWMVNNFSLRKDGIPGYAYGFPAILSLITPFVVRYINTSKIMAKKTLSTFSSAAGLLVISTSKDNKDAWINAGRVAQKIMLNLTKYGINFSISVAAIQSESHLSQMRMSLFRNSYPQFIMAVGFAENNIRQTPRHKLEDKLI